ncbi:rhamnogalacturonan endolyase [Marchantia polymorpha subsp. ruderalis]
MTAPDVSYTDNGSTVVLDNGTVQITITKPGGNVAVVKYGEMDNLLDASLKENDRGYWDMNWNVANGSDTYDLPSGTIFKLVHSDGDKVEVSFTRPYDSTKTPAMLPLDVDKRFVLLRGSSGFYTYGIYSRPTGWPDFDLNQLRVVFMPRRDNFQYMAVADNKLRLMPSPDDLTDARSEELGYKEARLLTNPIEPSLKGQVDDKYQYSEDNKDMKVHGWMSKDTNPTVGFWMITPSNEFKNGGPMKADLTCHTGPTCLSMFHSAHYAGIDLCPQFRNGEAWKKVFGPVYVYLNQRPAGTTVRHLWDDAKAQMATEVAAWPYTWPSSSDYPHAADRGQVSGRLFVQDSYASLERSSARDAWVGLSLPGDVGTWQTESKGYQFWTKADSKGNFSIQNVRAGTYSLNAWVPSVIGDYLKDGQITVAAGDSISLGDLTYTPPRYGPTVWEIGNPSRTAADFYIPDPDSRYPNLLYGTVEKWRNYGLWQRYTDLYPSQDLIYTVGTSDYTKDWFFAHLCRHESDGTWVAATWQIKFNLSTFDASQGAYKLRMAIAQAEIAAIQVRVNSSTMKPVYETPAFGKDNAIARHGIHGLYALYNIDIPAANLQQGANIIYLTQRKASGPFNGVMYDYLRLESPPVSSSSSF